jgi:hypothetical protein
VVLADDEIPATSSTANREMTTAQPKRRAAILVVETPPPLSLSSRWRKLRASRLVLARNDTADLRPRGG